jgi:excisionase family DNA binding protein
MGKITKEEAAQILNVKGVRTVERYAADGWLSVTYEKGTTRDVPMYDESEVRALAVERQKPRTPARPSFEPSGTASQAIATRDDNNDARLSQAVAFKNFLEGLSANAGTAKTLPQVTVGEKVMLTLTDAAALSNLSENHLREAVKVGKLKGKIIGKGYKIKRVDLDAYIKKL